MLERLRPLPTARRDGVLDLKWALIRRNVIAALICVAFGVGIVLTNAATEARRQNLDVSKMIGGVLKVQLVRIDSGLDRPQSFPNWAAVLEYSLLPGQCIKLVVPHRTSHSRCIGTDSSTPNAPGWFLAIYVAYFLGNVDAAKPIVHKTETMAILKVTASKGALASQAWASVSSMLRLSVVLIAIMCLLNYVAVGQALKPTGEILSGLSKLTNGDLGARLPHYRLREMNQIAEGFNSLADQLRVTTLERLEFARRLIGTQEQERQHIARELHDDLGQQLTGLSGLAASIQSSLNGNEPVSRLEVDEMVKATGFATQSLRNTLTFLRPLEIDDLGLKASLEGLIFEHNRRARGSTRFGLETSGEVDRFDPETSAHIYRIVQEALNNAARHADADSVKVSLVNKGAEAMEGGSIVEHVLLSIEDDGSGLGEQPNGGLNVGYGLIGIRERVSALGGQLWMGSLPQGGLSVRVDFKVPDMRVGL